MNSKNLFDYDILQAVKNDVDIDRLVKIGKRGLLVWSKNTVETVTKYNKTPFI